ncbi:MAG: hypothetical protein B7Y84_11800 [Azorhizobium sp. 32-67-21]|nr:MAG: hypothetical protein B7Y84_11800 [Azorhizobium sp. 32-67-21]
MHFASARRPAPLFIVLCALLLTPLLHGIAAAAPVAPKPPKAAPDPRTWSLVKGEGAYVMRYGMPRDPEPDFAVTCQPGAQLLQFTAEVSGRPFASGEGVALTLGNGKRRMELAATAFLGAADGNLLVEAAVALERRVFDIFDAGDTLVLRIPSTRPKTQPVSLSFPLASAKGRFADFERACLERR